ncbi:MAG: type II secretion system GspH family protein [Defluviitaleaceae bacterium]|nr:type II secretion system GspH family protein [Defluviitaleaceae bacterium]
MAVKKKTRGFSYVEVIIAMALFAIAMLAVIPALTQAARNMTYAHETAEGHMQAQRLMHELRDNLDGDITLEARAAVYAASSFEYSVWITGQRQVHFSSTNAPSANTNISGINQNMASRASTIVVIVWGEDEQILGRAIGMTDFE